MKTFEDLVFKPHPIGGDAKCADLNLGNGYKASVILGGFFYSNGVDEYELAILKDGQVINDTVTGYLSPDEITEELQKYQRKFGAE